MIEHPDGTCFPRSTSGVSMVMNSSDNSIYSRITRTDGLCHEQEIFVISKRCRVSMSHSKKVTNELWNRKLALELLYSLLIKSG
ncbi:hypothetical protein CEXT_29611 [Caerostris extrusa]|uniref:Uncharacterized protein n=1 Tax=Caerostris extrusa TaxID=172846 RepID=A0AAV4U5Q4_CAEEX|nr:hypothetical protein CEXT_29611 [Caerostris extrusa]